MRARIASLDPLATLASAWPRASVFALFAIAACGGGAATDAGGATLRIVEGGQRTDTALGNAQPLIVEVRTGGSPRAGVAVQFSVQPIPPSGQSVVTQASLSAGASSFASAATVMTDAAGRATVSVKPGTIVGETRIAVSSADPASSATAVLRVEPGNTSRIVLSPRDTAFVAGASFQVRAYSADQSGNPTQEPIVYGMGPNVVSVDDSGRVRTAKVEGRGVVRATAAGVRDSVRFRSIVGGRLMYAQRMDIAWVNLVSADLDGGNVRIHQSDDWTVNLYANLSPAGDAYVQEREISLFVRAYITGSDRFTKTIANPLVLPYTARPQFSADGQYVYFSGQRSNIDPSAIWRARPDGSGLEQVTTPTVASGGHTIPAPSPDGSQLAYRDANGLQVITFATGSVVKVGPASTLSAVFSPDGRFIAYLSNQSIAVVAADGTGTGTIATNLALGERPSWLPHSNWLVIPFANGVQLFDVITNERASLPWLTSGYRVVSAP